jgi:NAD(P)-dependent dehydrogenase (short-subunit alcohol dehydrogenase family)
MSKVWLITGCSSGIGRELARRALTRGDRVVATARNPERLAELVNEFGERALPVALDVTDPAQSRHAVDACVAAFGRLDVLCSNAGYGIIAALEEHSDEQLEKNIRTNLIGPLQLIRAALPVLRAQRSGHILVISAIAALSNHEGFAVYGGAKAGLEGACEALAIELRPLGVKVSMVLPGPTRTDFIGRSLEQGATKIPDYDATSGKFARLLAGMNGKQTGDPGKLADLTIALTDEGSPPLRLVTGKYAIARAKAKLRAVGAELEAWEPRGAATDY